MLGGHKSLIVASLESNPAIGGWHRAGAFEIRR